MKSILSATVCAAAMAFAVPAMAAGDDATTATPTHHHHHHAMHGRHAGMRNQREHGGDAETARLNEQSLQNARGGAAPASGSAAGAGMTSGGGAAGSSGTSMAPAQGSGASGNMSAPPGSTHNGMETGNDTAVPATTTATPPNGSTTAPGTGMSAPSSGSMGNSMQNNAPSGNTTGDQ
jgi:hypothetical protein